MAQIFQCTSTPNLSESAFENPCESSQNWGSYEQKKTTYIKELSFKFRH